MLSNGLLHVHAPAKDIEVIRTHILHSIKLTFYVKTNVQKDLLLNEPLDILNQFLI